jgi:isoamylase
MGATWDGGGTNFSVFSEHATLVELCLFDGDDETRVEMNSRRAMNWHCYLPGIGPGQRYGFRVHGPYAPREGHRFNPAKLLIDPYAKAIDGVVDWAHDANVLPYVPTGSEDADLEPDDEDDAPAMPKSVVIDDAFLWEGDRPPGIPFADTVIYETHVKGLTMRHPDVREDLRGTYAGLASDPAIAYLKDLGVTAVELLPVHHIADESFLAERGLTNYWGYSTIGFFAPHALYAATGRLGEQVREFKGMVKALHRAGIEVILDVVYNHTGEGNHLGPMLSFKGADNASYYRLVPDDPRMYMDFTGTGNSLNPVHPSVLRLIMDSLRYWVIDCHVDGFRFDLAAALAREFFDVDRLSAFFDVIHQDPVLSQVKLIAEPWDVGPGGYQVGNFPVLWSEWNGVYRDTMRDWWRGHASCGQFAERLAGSSDLYEADGREPFASINFITAHDGFTLADLVSYEGKHNEANGEDNRDGTDDNRSWNTGAEGATDDQEIVTLRRRRHRNFLTTLFVSQGTPMLLGGDELGRTQHGNNNGWCQDNEISWYDWTPSEESSELRDFTRRLIELRRAHRVFRRESFLRGREQSGSGLPDVWWFRPDGMKMTRHDWQDGPHLLGMFLNGREIPDRGPRGETINGDSFVVLFNAEPDEHAFTLPRRRFGAQWTFELSTFEPTAAAGSVNYVARSQVPVQAHTVVILKRLP